ncbi:lysozyme [Hoylesella buccalis]|uniref:lysozyme n=1 Tax=Hoylesella buccalis TaxID=28127 RepID=UPI001D153307|nr:lysozyme [Hoylesella buccalis]UEA63066.1 lysozyme [Hoylesella buccalis]UWP49644.1 lysozyme [Hoylesella buccalis ATCC 35310]
MKYRASDTLISKLKAFEGLRLVAYKPTKAERWYTIGYGHSAGDVKAGMRINEEKAEELLKRDLFFVEKFINGIPKIKTQGQFDALVSFTYNVGIGKLKASTLLKKIMHDASTAEIQREFMKWVYSGGKKLDGLVRRRRWEAERYGL